MRSKESSLPLSVKAGLREPQIAGQVPVGGPELGLVRSREVPKEAPRVPGEGKQWGNLLGKIAFKERPGRQCCRWEYE